MNEAPETASTGYLAVARQPGAALLRVVGLGSMNLSLTLRDVVLSTLEEGRTHLVLDLDDCTGMDSTFMGTLVDLALRLDERDGWLCVVNLSADHRRLLQMVGAWDLLPVRERVALAPVETEAIEPDENPARRLEQIRRAHDHLAAIDERNRERYGLFLRSMEREMDANRATPPAGSPEDPAAYERLRDASRHPPPPPESLRKGEE